MQWQYQVDVHGWVKGMIVNLGVIWCSSGDPYTIPLQSNYQHIMESHCWDTQAYTLNWGRVVCSKLRVGGLLMAGCQGAVITIIMKFRFIPTSFRPCHSATLPNHRQAIVALCS